MPFLYFFFMFIEPQGALHGERNQPSLQFQADRLAAQNIPNTFATLHFLIKTPPPDV
jgi:hypothetical protein